MFNFSKTVRKTKGNSWCWFSFIKDHCRKQKAGKEINFVGNVPLYQFVNQQISICWEGSLYRWNKSFQRRRRSAKDSWMTLQLTFQLHADTLQISFVGDSTTRSHIKAQDIDAALFISTKPKKYLLANIQKKSFVNWYETILLHLARAK